MELTIRINTKIALLSDPFDIQRNSYDNLEGRNFQSQFYKA